MKKRICITSECVCDLPDHLLQKYNIKLLYYYIITDHGSFKDVEEITSNNVIEYFHNGGKHIHTMAPSILEYEAFFENMLHRECEEVIHISLSSTLTLSYVNATEAACKFKGKVHVIDSAQLSTGMAHLILKGCELAEEGKSSAEIIQILEGIKYHVSSTFIAESADYLYLTERVSKFVKVFCSVFKIHPILSMRKGKLGLKGIRIGNYEKGIMRYIDGELKHNRHINTKRAFLTHAACPVKLVSSAKERITAYYPFDELIVTDACAAISSNCGANTLGILYLNDYNSQTKHSKDY